MGVGIMTCPCLLSKYLSISVWAFFAHAKLCVHVIRAAVFSSRQNTVTAVQQIEFSTFIQISLFLNPVLYSILFHLPPQISLRRRCLYWTLYSLFMSKSAPANLARGSNGLMKVSLYIEGRYSLYGISRVYTKLFLLLCQDILYCLSFSFQFPLLTQFSRSYYIPSFN
jgi:hypothetical protein